MEYLTFLIPLALIVVAAIAAARAGRVKNQKP
jgi:nitrogen fixation-related uncharacterized protein